MAFSSQYPNPHEKQIHFAKVLQYRWQRSSNQRSDIQGTILLAPLVCQPNAAGARGVLVRGTMWGGGSAGPGKRAGPRGGH